MWESALFVMGRMEKYGHGSVRKAPPRYSKTSWCIQGNQSMSLCRHACTQLIIRWLTRSVCEMGGRGKRVENIEMLWHTFRSTSTFWQWLLSCPNLVVVKEVRLLLCSQSILCIEKKSKPNEGHWGSSRGEIKWLVLKKQVLEICLLKWSKNKFHQKFGYRLIWKNGWHYGTESVCVCLCVCSSVFEKEHVQLVPDVWDLGGSPAACSSQWDR